MIYDKPALRANVKSGFLHYDGKSTALRYLNTEARGIGVCLKYVMPAESERITTYLITNFHEFGYSPEGLIV